MDHVQQNKLNVPIPLLIEQLIVWGCQKGLLDDFDITYIRNQLIALFNCREPIQLTTTKLDVPDQIDHIVEQLIDYGYHIGLIESNTILYRDLLDAKIIGLMMLRPSQFVKQFHEIANNNGIQEATQYFYDLSINSRYIRMDRVQKNPMWNYSAPYGKLEITINLSKPEKNPLEIAKLKSLPQADYPKCLLCKENVGYEGRLDHPARQNLRVLPVSLQGEQWYLQYSPYVYYNEHSIVFSDKHVDMKITDQTFARLLDFVDQFPHYFIGSNADLPIVGGSILNHDHYQAGRHIFPMEKANCVLQFSSEQYVDVTLQILDWPLSVIRLTSLSNQSILAASSHILHSWKAYTDEEHHIYAYTEFGLNEKVAHNTITPIARKRSNQYYELDLVLRNNRTSTQYPFGIFHPDESLHHIKKENIGLIEVMGLAVLPARLKSELEGIVQLLVSRKDEDLEKISNREHPLYEHREWIKTLFSEVGWLENEQVATHYIYGEAGKKFSEVLKCSGIFKQNKAGINGFCTFINHLGFYT